MLTGAFSKMNNNTKLPPATEALELPSLSEIKLSTEQREVFIEVIGTALGIKHKTQLFRWTQSVFQYLIGHDVMMYANQSASGQYHYQFLTSTRYFGQKQLNQITEENGLVTTALQQWKKHKIPLFVTNTLKEGAFSNHQVIGADEKALQQSELQNFLLHGFSNESSLVVFGRLHKAPNQEMAHIVELMMPYLHNIISNLSHDESGNLLDESHASYKKLSKREVEIIKWVHHGKTNREISEQLSISPLTVKNHVQNIIKKLSVQNRRQAAAKAFKLGMFEIA